LIASGRSFKKKGSKVSERKEVRRTAIAHWFGIKRISGLVEQGSILKTNLIDINFL